MILGTSSRTSIETLYVGPLDPSGTCAARLRGLMSVNAGTEAMDTSFVASQGGRLRNYLAAQLCFDSSFVDANRILLAKVKQSRPAVVWIDKGYWVWRSTLERIAQQGVLLVHHNTDDIHAAHAKLAYRLLRSTIKYYDIHFTSNHHNLSNLRALGARRVEFTHLGYDHERFYRRELTPSEAQNWTNDVVFVGHWEAATEHHVLGLVEAGLPVRVYGTGWHNAKTRNYLSSAVTFRSLSADDYVSCLLGAKIGLCFLSKLNRNDTAGRTFEIPACGTFLLAERTPAHQLIYREGEEAEFFADETELTAKVRFYLDNSSVRAAIAEKGQIRCLSSGYSWLARMREDWNKVATTLEQRSSCSRTYV